MAAKYVTVKHSDADFLKYLWGQKEQQVRALPVKSYNVGTPEEAVTFELKKISEIPQPNVFVYISSLIKLKSFVLVLFPLFFVLIKTYTENNLNDPFALSLAAIATLFLFAGLNVRNDISDHISGYDRVNADTFSQKPIRLGWISALKASHWSNTFILVSVFLGLPVVLMYFELIKLLGISLGLFFVGRFTKNSYKDEHFGELVLFILIGPALAVGYQISAGAAIDAEILFFGVLWGLAVLFLVQMNNFSHIMTSSQAKIKNTMTQLGFDLSQKFLVLYWSVFIGSWGLFHFLYRVNVFSVLSFVILLLFSGHLFKSVLNIKSPMGSGLQKVRILAYRTFAIMLALFLVENILQLQVY